MLQTSLCPAGDDALVKACKLNLSSCYLNQGKTQACITVCSEILALDPGNRKALYRRGQAHLASQDAQAAVRCALHGWGCRTRVLWHICMQLDSQAQQLCSQRAHLLRRA